MIKTYRVDVHLGIAAADECAPVEVESRSKPDKLRRGISCYYFYDQAVGEVMLDGELVTARGKRRNMSGHHYVGGKIYSQDALPGGDEYRILRDNAQSNGWERMLLHDGRWMPLEDGDCVV